jgi:hypothetical protein
MMTQRSGADTSRRHIDNQRLAQAIEGDEEALAELASSDRVNPAVSLHRIGPLLAGHATRLKLTGPTVDAWRQTLLQTAARRLGLNHALEHVGATLDAAGIPWLPVKGMGLPPGAYERLEERPTTDLDVLVRPAGLETAVAALREAGWRDVHPDPVCWRFLVEEGYNWQAVGSFAALLELHFRLWGSIPEAFVAELFDRSLPDPVRGGLARAIDPVDAAILAAVHVWQTPIPRPLLFLWDVQRLTTAVLGDAQRDELVSRTTAAGLQLYLAAAMRCVATLWPSDTATDLTTRFHSACGRFERRLLDSTADRDWDELSLGRLILARLLDRRPSRTGWKAPWRSFWPHPGTLASRYASISSPTRRRLHHLLDIGLRPTKLAYGVLSRYTTHQD